MRMRKKSARMTKKGMMMRIEKMTTMSKILKSMNPRLMISEPFLENLSQLEIGSVVFAARFTSAVRNFLICLMVTKMAAHNQYMGAVKQQHSGEFNGVARCK